MKAKITQALLGTLKPGSYDLSDLEQRGLVLRVRPSGAHSWLLRLGRGKWFTLGRADVLKPAKARELAQLRLGEQAAGRDPIAEKRRKRAGTLEEFLNKHYDAWARAHLKTGDQTSVRARATFAEFLKKPIPEITAFAVQTWRSKRHRDGTRATTTNRDLDCLRSVLSKAVEWGVLAEHPLRSVKRATVDTIGRLRYLSADEERRLRDALTAREQQHRSGRARFNAWRTERGYRTIPDYAPGAYVDHLQPIVLLALNTGLRRGDLLALRWADVDRVRALLTVRGASAKTGRTRYLPLNAEALDVLKTWRPRDAADDDLVFPGADGEPMTTLKTAWGKVSKAAGLKGFRFHDLRHSFASNLVQAGVDLNTVRELLGHSDIKMTLRYAHLASEQKAAAVAKLVAG